MARGIIKLAALAGLAQQAREYARKNPESVSSAIGKVESLIGRKVGPKYADQVGKGGNALRSGLGISSARPATGAAATPRDDVTSSFGATSGTGSTNPPPSSGY